MLPAVLRFPLACPACHPEATSQRSARMTRSCIALSCPSCAISLSVGRRLGHLALGHPPPHIAPLPIGRRLCHLCSPRFHTTIATFPASWSHVFCDQIRARYMRWCLCGRRTHTVEMAPRLAHLDGSRHVILCQPFPPNLYWSRPRIPLRKLSACSGRGFGCFSIARRVRVEVRRRAKIQEC